METTYTTIVGMEIHVELSTASKMFCGCKNDPFNAPKPNIYTCPVCLGLPGGLPVPNKKAVEWTIMLGLALGCDIARLSKFDRKNYFYPDLAKGYQISQYDMPLCTNGVVHIPEGDVRIHRVHLEEDTGKLQHTSVDGKQVTLVDFNRSGVPLVEIVTEPDIRNSDQAKAFLKKLHQIVRYLGISQADMDKGSMRLEPNISVLKSDDGTAPGIHAFTTSDAQSMAKLPPYKVEVKNINSFSFVKKAIDFEVARHIEILKTDAYPKQETRGFEESRGVTVPQRSKEDAKDYRYFPEPDIPPMRFTDDEIETIQKSLPELPDAAFGRLKTEYGIPDSDISLLVDNPVLLRFYEAAVASGISKKYTGSPKTIANYIINKQVDTASDPSLVIDALVAQSALSDCPIEDITKAVTSVVAANTKAVIDYKSGKTGVLMFLLGMVKRELKGRGDAAVIETELKKLISA